MIHSIKRKFQWGILKTLKSFKTPNSYSGLDTFSKEAHRICSVLINKPESILLMSPISGKRYIQSVNKQLSIIIEQGQLTIVNHQYSYNIYLDDYSLGKIKSLFDNEVEIRRNKMEVEIRSNIKHSLLTICQNLTNENI